MAKLFCLLSKFLNTTKTIYIKSKQQVSSLKLVDQLIIFKYLNKKKEYTWFESYNLYFLTKYKYEFDHCLPCNLSKAHLLLYKHPCSSCQDASTQRKWHQWKRCMYLSVLALWVKRLTRKKAACLTHRQQFNVPWHQLNNVYLSLSLYVRTKYSPRHKEAWCPSTEK